MPKFAVQYLAKIAVSWSFYPKFSFRQLPSASVNFIGIPLPHVLCNLDNMLYGWGVGSQVSGPII